MIRKPTLRFVDLCIDVDANIMSKDPKVIERVYTELTLIAYMLILKKKYFNKLYYSELFAYYLANITYIRMTTDRQFLPETDPKFLSPVKSCLNYMKAVLYPKKCEFAAQEFGFSTREGDAEAAELSKNYMAGPIRADAGLMRLVEVRSYLRSLPGLFKKVVKECAYGNNTRMAHYIYISIVKSFIDTISLTPQQKKKIDRLRSGNSLDDRILNAISKFYLINSDAPSITYGLGSDFETYIHVLMQKIKRAFTSDIREISAEYDLSDKVIEDVIKDNLSEILEETDS